MTLQRVAIVTGASRGIGRSIFERLAEEGFAVVGCARTEGAAEVVASALREAGFAAIGVQADVSDATDVQRVVDAAMGHYGRLDVLVNNAGIYRAVGFLDLSEADWNYTLAVNLTGSFLCARAAAKAMIASDVARDHGGRIINIASSNGIRSEGHCADYNVSKAGQIALTNSLALDLAEYGILCTTVAPGWIGTEIDAAYHATLPPEERKRLNTLGRVGRPEEVAHAVAMLCDPRATFINAATVLVDGGQVAVNMKLL